MLFDDVINLYKNKFQGILKQYPFSVAYENEKARDTGGVSRDMFSQFLDEACLKCFGGGNILVPAINPHTDTSLFSSPRYCIVPWVSGIKLSITTSCFSFTGCYVAWPHRPNPGFNSC